MGGAADLASLDPTGAWTGLQRVALIESERRTGDQVRRENRAARSSLPPDAARLGRAVRAHWGIDSRRHGVLHSAFREDASRYRAEHGPAHLAIVRQFALNLLRREPGRASIAKKRFRAVLDERYLRTLLDQLHD